MKHDVVRAMIISHLQRSVSNAGMVAKRNCAVLPMEIRDRSRFWCRSPWSALGSRHVQQNCRFKIACAGYPGQLVQRAHAIVYPGQLKGLRPIRARARPPARELLDKHPLAMEFRNSSRLMRGICPFFRFNAGDQRVECNVLHHLGMTVHRSTLSSNGNKGVGAQRHAHNMFIKFFFMAVNCSVSFQPVIWFCHSVLLSPSRNSQIVPYHLSDIIAYWYNIQLKRRKSAHAAISPGFVSSRFSFAYV